MEFPYNRKAVKIKWGENEAEFVVRELTLGEYEEIMKQVMKPVSTSSVGGVPSYEIDAVSMQRLVLLRCIEKAPFEINEENIKKLPVSVALKLYEAVQEVNPFLATGEQ